MEEPPAVEAPADARRPGPERTRDWFGMIVSIAALITSFVSIVLAVQNSDSMNRLVQANSWPYLQLMTSNVADDGSRSISVQVRNTGIGPLRIETFVVTANGRDVGDVVELVKACCLAKETEIISAEDFAVKVGGILTNNPTGMVLGPGDEVTVFALPRQDAVDAVWRTLDKARFKNRYRACYCSVFDECWTSDFKSSARTPVKSCKPEAESWSG